MGSRLSILNPEPTVLPGPRLLHDLVANAGDDTAIDYLSSEDTHDRLSYRQLHDRSNALAHRLRAIWEGQAASKDSRFIVPLLCQQSPDLYIAELAVLKAGGAFCPVSVDCPEERIRFMCQDVEAKMLVTTKQLQHTLPALDGVTLLVLDGETPEYNVTTPSLAIDPSQPAYVMYTSGSTGLPKGVILSHSAATQALLAHDRHIPAFSRFLQFASPTFDVSVFEIFFPFYRHGTLVCGDRRKLLTDLPGFINQMRVDAAELTPSVASNLLRSRQNVPNLRLLLTIGEMLKRDVVEEFGGSAEQDSILYGMYGPTEATIHCTLQTSFSKDMSVQNIGVPLDTVSAFVVQPRSEGESTVETPAILPYGEEGELAVGGHQLADYYLNRPEQTKAAFFEHPEYGQLYRTGDRAKMTDSGALECLGRLSGGQVKLRGQRIELGEIEYAASKTLECQTAVADVIEGTLVVFCVCQTRDVTSNMVLDVCRKWLPAFMVPADVIILDQLPYLDSGKVNRKGLAEIYADNKTTLTTSNEISSPRLHKIKEAVAQVLQTPVHGRISGLDSLTSIRLASELKKVGFAQANAAELLSCRNVQDIDALVEEFEQDKDSSAASEAFNDMSAELRAAIKQQTDIANNEDLIEDIFPATPVQSAMLSETLRDRRLYCNWIEFKIPMRCTPEVVERSLHSLAEQHSLLRAGFVSVHGVSTTHAVVVCKCLQESQIRHVRHLDREFSITEEADLLHPCSFQILASGDDLRIGVAIHHSLYDQWSMDVLRADLAILLRGGQIAPPPSYRSISAQCSRSSGSAKSSDDREFWQGYLKDFTPALLPHISGKKLPRQQERTSWQTLELDHVALKTWSDAIGCTPAAVFQATISYMLGVLTGTQDITYGVVYSGRHLPVTCIERMFGPCLTTLPFRANFDDKATCSDLVRSIRDNNRVVQNHALIPLAEIKGAADSPQGSSLFDALFIWQESTVLPREDAEILHEVASIDQHEFNLVVEVAPVQGCIQARITYESSMISSKQIHLLLRQLTYVTQHMIAEPEMPVARIATSMPDELLSISNPFPSACASGRDLLGNLRSFAQHTPTATAICFATSIKDSRAEVETMNYREFNDRSNALATYFRSLGALPGELLCICMDKAVNLYLAIIATLKTGCGYVPLLPDTPPDRIKSVLEQSEVSICICDDESEALFQSFDRLRIVNIDHANKTIGAAAELPGIRDEDVAYCVYTSGSTGQPKGVSVTAQNLVGNLQALSELYGVQPGDRLLQACSQAFDVSVFEIFFSFYAGMTLCSAKKDVLFNDLESSIRALQVTHLSLTPTVAALIEPSNVPSVKFLVTAGEGVTDLVHQRWAGKGLQQGYGPSETTNICTVNMNMQPDHSLRNIGRPLRNTSALVVAPGRAFEILPAGAIGEFCFGGEQVFRGYIGRDDLNSEVIINHERYGRLYRSGDVGRILSDGSLQISGRVDDSQVKIRGNRIELDEINAVLMRDPAVRDCTTIVVRQSSSEQSLVSFVVPKRQTEESPNGSEVAIIGSLTVDGILELLEAAIPAYMIPSQIVPITSLPVTFQGKIDRRYLKGLLEKCDPTQYGGRLAQNDASLASTGPTMERQIGAALAKVVRLPPEKIMLAQSFFALGLNSLTAISFAKLLTHQLEVDVKVHQVLRNSSVSRLAELLSSEAPMAEANGKSVERHLLPKKLVRSVYENWTSKQEEIEAILPCTPLQEAMLAAGSSLTHSAYCNTTTFHVKGDLTRLEQCWQAVVARHSILRTTFLTTEDKAHPYVQVVLKSGPKGTLRYEGKHQAELNGTSENTSPVTSTIPFRLEIVEGASGTTLILHMHHAIYDGMSMSLMLNDVESLYREERMLSPASLEPFLYEVQRHNNDEAMSFWSRHIDEFVPKPMVNSRPGSAAASTIRRQLHGSEDKLAEFCKRHAVAQLSVLQTAFATVVAHLQNTKDLCFGNIMSGRTVPVDGIERLVAPCFNTVPVRVNLSRPYCPLEWARRLNRHNTDALNYQLTPLRRIQALSKAPARHLFDALLLLQPEPQPIDDTIWTLEEETGSMDLPLVLELEPESGNYNVSLHFLQPNISDDHAKAILDLFVAALDSCLDSPYSILDPFRESAGSSCLGLLASEELGNDISSDADTDETPCDEEEIIGDVFALLAGVGKDMIRRDTSMYQIGLDSLNAAQVAARLRSSGINVDAADVMEALTPRALAAMARKKRSTSKSSLPSIDLNAFEEHHRATLLEAVGVPESELEAVRPCTSIQAGMLVQSVQSHGQLYINHITFQVPASVSSTTIRSAWEAVASRHQVLHMGFHQVQDPIFFYAMSIRKHSPGSVPMREMQKMQRIDDLEAGATEQIMQNLTTQPWCITFQEGREHNTMVISLHHALYDASSLQLMYSDLRKAMNTSKLGPPLSIDEMLLSTLEAESDWDGSAARFWDQVIQDTSSSAFPNLTPTLVEHSELQTSVHSLEMHASSLEEFCRKSNATIQALGQSAWAILLAAYMGDHNVVFGTVTSGSPPPTDARVAFPSITTIPVPCHADCSPRDLLQQMVDFNAKSHRHRFTPLAEIQRHGGQLGQQLFDTVFVYQKTATADHTLDWHLIKETAAVDYCLSLELEVVPSGSVDIRLTFDTSRIPRAHAQLLLRQYDHIITSMVRDQAGIPDEIYSVSSAKEEALPSPSITLHGLFEHTAREHPDHIALEFISQADADSVSARKWTYQELEERANQVAHLIRRADIGPHNIIAVCMAQCPEASFAFLGILKAGCSFLAMDPDLPPSRRKFILQDSEARLLLLSATTQSADLDSDVPSVNLSEKLLRTLPTWRLETNVPQGADSCYQLYTSGTTGMPKGCEITHENAVQAMMAFQRLFAGRWTGRSRWLQFASYWFDVSVLEHFWTWSVGMTVVGAPRDVVLEDIPGFIRRHGITHIDLTPSLACLVHPDDVPSLWDGVFITGGEALRQEVIDVWGSKRSICNGYGPTETTIGVTMNRFIGPDALPSNIGKQFDNVTAYVLQPESDEPVLKGAVGELCIAGPLVAKGYLNRADLTERQFPYLERLGKRIYRTGDLVRMLADHSFSFMGRKDSQTKLRGQRLEVAEIDSVIQKSDDNITHVVSEVIKASGTGKETLVTFLTTNAAKRVEQLCLVRTDDDRALARKVREACVQHLPGYMVPTHILPIDYLPLTSNNKVDSKQLIQLFHSCSLADLQNLQGSGDTDRALNDSERKISEDLERLLKIDRTVVTPQTNVFSLGLSSISAISFTTLLKRSGFKAAHVATIMKNPVLSQLSAALAVHGQGVDTDAGMVEQAKLSLAAFSQRHRGVAARTLSEPLENLEIVQPLTPLQEGLVFESLNKDDQPYLNHFYYDVKVPDVGLLLEAFQKLVDNTQALRTRFVETEGGYAQAVLRRYEMPRTCRKSCDEDEIGTLLAEAKQKWLEKNRHGLELPWEVLVIDTMKRTILAMHIHHALYDGISFDLLLGKLTEIYNDESSVDNVPTFMEALPYGPLCPVDGKAFWTRHLERSRRPALPTASDTQQNSDPMVQLHLNSSVHIEEARKQFGVSHQAIVQASFEIALQMQTPTVKTYGMVVSGRSIDLEGAEKVLGPMFNTLPTTSRVQADSTMAKHTQQRHEENVEMLPFQHTPLRDIRKWCCDDPSDPMFDVLFVFQHQSRSTHLTWTELLQPLPSVQRAEYPLACEVEMNDDGTMIATFLAKRVYFDQEQLQDLCNAFEAVVNSISSTGSLHDEFGIASSSTPKSDVQGEDLQPYMNGVEGFQWTTEAEIVRDAVAKLSGVDSSDVDEHTTIFTLGLDSIDTVKLSSQLKRAGLILPVSKILKAQTIPRMLEMLQTGTANGAAHAGPSEFEKLELKLRSTMLPNLQRHLDVASILPVTAQQEGLIADMLRSELREYFNHDVLKLEHVVDLERLKGAWQTVVDGSPILRTSFVEVSDPDIDAVYAQVVHKKHELQFTRRSVESIDNLEEAFESIRRDVLEAVQSSPPLRLTIVEAGSDRYMILSLAHAQYDGQSLALLHEDVMRAYHGAYSLRSANDEVIEAALAANTKDARSFWAGMLSGTDNKLLPARTFSTGPMDVHRVERKSRLSATTVRDFCRTNSVSIQALAQTCWSLTLAHYTQSMEVLFGVVLSCRETDDAEEIMFPTMNTVVCRSSLHGSRVETLRYMQDMISDMRPWQRTPLRVIQAAAAGNTKQKDSSIGLFDTLFIYQKRQTPKKMLAAPIWESVGGSSDIEYPVAVEMEDAGESLLMRAACKDHILDEAGTRQMLAELEQVLDAIVEAPNKPIVGFNAGKVSICGLKPFSLKTADTIQDQRLESTTQANGMTEEKSATVLAILEALAQVAKVPFDQLDATVAIETIGIDSISAIKVAGLLRKQDINISVSQMLKSKTAAQMARVAKSKSEQKSTSSTEKSSTDTIKEALSQFDLNPIADQAGIDVNNIECLLPATAGQVYMLSMWRKTRGQLFYPTFKYQLSPEVTLEQIKQAWKELMAKHAILRTVFCSTENEQVPMLQLVLNDAPDNFHQDGDASQNVATQPMVSLRARKHGEGYTLDLNIHHALYDAISLPLLIRDLNSLLGDSTTQLPEPAINFADFLAPQLTSSARGQRKEFWTQYLSSVQPRQLSQPTSNGPQRRVELFQPGLFQEAARLETIVRKEGLSTQALLFAAWARLYPELASSEPQADSEARDVVLGIYLSSRSHLPDLESLAAPTVNMVPLLVCSPQTQGLLEVARAVQADLQKIGGMMESSVGLWEIKQWTGVEVDCFVNLLRLPDADDGEAELGEGEGLKIREVDQGRTEKRSEFVEAEQGISDLPAELKGLENVEGAFKHSLDVEMAVIDGRLDVGLFCPEAMFSLEKAEGAVEEFIVMLEEVAGKAKG